LKEGAKIFMLTPEQIERWQTWESERQQDESHIARHRQRDSQRRHSQQEMLVLLKRFLDEEIGVEDLRTTFDKKTRTDWDQFGFKGMSGAMFLNTLVKHIPDTEMVAHHLCQVLPLPPDAATGRQRMQTFYNVLSDLTEAGQVTRRQVQAARIPFFVSGWWHLQATEEWPVFYTSGRQALEKDGLYQSGTDPVADYFAFRQVFLALANALNLPAWEMEHLLVWKQNQATQPPPETEPSVLVETPVVTAMTDDTDMPDDEAEETDTDEPLGHSHIQWLLAKIGHKLGCKVWIAANDHRRSWQGETLGSLSESALPNLGLDQETERIIKLIDVIWLQGRKVAAAFEVEKSTQIFSGLLRMSDLLAVAPNLTIPLYIVAPERRMEKTRRELQRPTFQTLGLHEQCGFFSFEDLVKEAPGMLRWASDPVAIDRLAQKADTVSNDW
jgi:hypothetical protein